MKYESFNRQIITLVGGKENISAVVHCMTRLRFTLKDRSKAKTEEIQKMDGVIDVVNNEVSYQIIIGTHVSEVHAELISMLGMGQEDSVQQTEKTVKKNPFKAALDLVSESMTPLLEPIIAAGDCLRRKSDLYDSGLHPQRSIFLPADFHGHVLCETPACQSLSGCGFGGNLTFHKY